MDYDDNDFQSQNHHLAGEGSTKFPPVLRPYDLPKFEFDDTLQGHLRFDSLVETEVFLGIEGNEDNQWIEDFSRGNSGIEFSSSAAESCSIARRNNVWSEATSSESVEMLLKSVGQEDIIPVQNTVKDSDVCDELGILVKQMEPSLKHDGNISSSTGDAIHLQPALLNDEIHGNLSETKEDVVEERPGVEIYSQDHECETSADGIPSDLDPNAVNENCDLPLTGGNMFTDGKFENMNESKRNLLIDESQENRIPELASSVEIQVDNMITSTHNISTTSAEVSKQEPRHVSNDINDKNISDIQVENDEGRELPVMGTSEAESGICITDDTPCLAAEVESVEEPNAGNSSIGDVEEFSTMIVKGDSNLPIVEGCNNAGCSNDSVQGSKHEGVLHSGKEIENQPDANVHKVSLVDFEDDGVEEQSTVNALEVSPMTFKVDGNFEGDAVELCSSSAATCASLEPNINSQSSVSKNKGVLLAAGQLGSDTLVSYSGASLLSFGDNIISKGECNGNSSFHVGGNSTLTAVHSSADLHQEIHAADALKCTNGASGVCNETVDAEDHGSPSIFVESVQMCKEKIISTKVDAQSSNQDFCVYDMDKKEFPSHSDVGVCEIGESLNVDKEVESSLSGGVSKANKVVALDLDSSPSVVNQSGKAVTSDRGQQEVDRSPPVLGFTHLNEKEEKEETACEKFQEASEIGPVSEFGKRQLLCEAGDQSNAEKMDEHHTAVADEVMQECSKEMETYSLLVESTEKECDAAETVVEKSEELPLKESHENASLRISDADLIPREGEMVAQSGPTSSEKTFYDIDKKDLEEKEAAPGSGDKVSGKIVVINTEGAGGNGGMDSDKSTCGSPTVIRAVQPSQCENKEGVEGSSGEQNFPVQLLSPKGKDASKSESSFTFEVSSLAYLSGNESGKSSQPLSAISSSKLLIVEGSPLVPGSGQRKTKTTQHRSRGSPKVSDGETVRGGAKGTTERKARRASTKGAGKDSARKDNITKEGTPVQKSDRGDKLNNVSLTPSGMGQVVPSNIVQLHTTTSSLPDLNSSASPSSMFQQPFTDMQQVQLRAQIFVYGSLIQGVAPDEAYMISAFSGPDGGRSTWENAWRTALERSHSLKSPSVNPETPLPPRSGARASDQAVKQSGIQSKAISTPVGRASSKGTPSNTVNPMIPLSSPLWSIPTPSDTLQPISLPRGPVMEYQPALSPLHPYQTPPARNFVAHNTWLSQPPFRGPWIASAQTSTVDTSVRFPLLPNTEPVLLTPVKELSGSHSSGVKHVPSGSTVYSGGPPSVFTGAAPHLDLKKGTVSPGQLSSDSKPRKRKKVSNSGDPSQNVLLSQSQTEPVSAPAVSVTNPTSSFSITTPSSLVAKPSSEKLIMPPSSEKLIMPVSTVSIIDNLKRAAEPEPRGILPEEAFNKFREAKLHAEEAAALAASAVNHSQEIWSQLDKQKYSELSSDVEAKLASAAVAVAAAASVAKAAAAAANVACNAALQTKLMADEALVSRGYGNLTQGNGVSLTSDSTIISATATPVSILKGDDRTNSSSSIIVAAKEAARKRVEAASAASKRAEILDAIVKAAELAAEAVSQAGKIVCMGDPLPLKELVEHGPSGYWNVPQVSSDLVTKSMNVNSEEFNRDNAGAVISVPSKFSEGPSAENEIQTTNCGMPTAPQEIPRDSMEDHVRLVDGIVGSPSASEKISKGQKGRKAPESDIGVGSTSFPLRIVDEKGVESSRDNNIKEGSQVEVFKNEERFKAAWYPANVLSLKDGKAYVGYKELLSDEGLGPLKEWVALEREGDESPIIRVARPMTALQFEGTRKRRRAAMGNYSWSVGDRVDALIQDSWWEGVVTEKNKKDETTLTIHFPARNETSVVRAWHLRPSLFCKDGEWIEWSSSREKDPSSHEGDTPQEKRLKMTAAVEEIKRTDKMSKSNDVEPGKTEDSRSMNLSANDQVFNIGKNSRDGNRPDTLRMIRTGLQKEGSRVVFGVPKPGKKRKFMDVSKHYVGDQSRKNNEAKDSAKISKYLMPQGSRGWKNVSKTDLKEKRVSDSKPKPAIKSGKPQSVSGRTLHQKAAPVSPSDDSTVSDNLSKNKDLVSHVENASEKNKTMEFASFSSSEGAAEGPILFSSLAIPLDAPASKKASTSNPKADRANKGRLAPAGTGGKLAKIDEDKVSNNNSAKSASEVVEPRRSVRRIQPTSRLLEGLQSSLIISKIPSISHDRSHKSQNKNASRGNNG